MIVTIPALLQILVSGPALTEGKVRTKTLTVVSLKQVLLSSILTLTEFQVAVGKVKEFVFKVPDNGFPLTNHWIEVAVAPDP